MAKDRQTKKEEPKEPTAAEPREPEAQPPEQPTTTEVAEPAEEEAVEAEKQVLDTGFADLDALSDLGQPVFLCDGEEGREDKPSVCVPVLHKLVPGDPQNPARGMYITTFVQPLTNGSALINYRGCEMWLANGPEGCSIAAGGKCLTAGHRWQDKETGQLRNVSTGGLGINAQGMRFFFDTPAARATFEKMGIPYDDGSPTCLKAQFKGSTLLDRLTGANRELRRKRGQERAAERRASSGDRPATARGGTVSVSGPSGDQQIGAAEENF